ncbi:MAG: nucleotide sugar dehydrogenase [bacterium]|nr:nucleotide sugar dehydrogenase [bacterium]
MQKNTVAIIGLGMVGLPLAKTIPKKFKLVGYDIKKIKTTFQTSTKDEIINGSEFIIVCVPTPVKNSNLPDLSHIIDVSKKISKQLEKGQTIIIESTINPGVCEEIILPILEKSGLKGGKDFHLAHCPERINPGDKKWNINNIPRNIGALSEKGLKKAKIFYKTFVKAEIKTLKSIKAAEASKIIENTFRDINIAYVNELAKSFDALGIDLIEVIEAASNKPFSFMPHYPGCGVGGHCIPVDPYYLINKAKKSGFDHNLLKKAREVNDSMPQYTVGLLESRIKPSLKNAKVGLLGLAYKADISDTRNSPSLKISEILKRKGAKVLKFDPYIKSNCKNLTDILKKSDYLIIGTAHKEFKKINGPQLKKHGIKIVIDGKNCLNKEEIERNGIIYKGIGH